MIKGRKRHLFVWRAASALVRPWLTKKFNYTAVPAAVEGPFLLLANHSTDFDPFLVGLSFKQQMYFVASEHVFRWGFVSWLLRALFDPISRLKGQSASSTVMTVLRALFDPISRLKGQSASSTVMTVLRRLKEGANVGIFAAGERTWDGGACPISPSTAKLARSCSATLVTYRLEGGYFSSPRWSKNTRKGKMRGSVVGVYTPETLKAMSLEEINEIICRDLSEDAYARQRREMTSFEGKAPAEELETILCVCPECGKFGTLHSSGDRLACNNCGFETRFTSFGFFDGGKFETVQDWLSWETSEIEALALRDDNGALFSDENLLLRRLLEGHKAEELGRKRLEMFRDRLVCGETQWKMGDISGMALHGRKAMNLSCSGENFELVSERACCMYKYVTAYKALRRVKDGLFSR